MSDGNQAVTRSAEERRATFAVQGIHLLRTSMQVQYQLSQMADQKANMLLGITFVIFTISLGPVKIGRPEVGGPPPNSPKDGPGNLLFFGAFTRLDEDTYVERLMEVATDSTAIGEAFARDIYQNGRVLAFKKFRLVGYAYRVLLSGLVLLAFVITHALGLLQR